jgi:hypothetical protein
MEAFCSKTVVWICIILVLKNSFLKLLALKCVWNQFPVVSTTQYSQLNLSMLTIALCVGCHGRTDGTGKYWSILKCDILWYAVLWYRLCHKDMQWLCIFECLCGYCYLVCVASNETWHNTRETVILKRSSRIFLEGLKKTVKPLCYCSWSSQDLNQAPFKCKSDALPLHQSVCFKELWWTLCQEHVHPNNQELTVFCKNYWTFLDIKWTPISCWLGRTFRDRIWDCRNHDSSLLYWFALS